MNTESLRTFLAIHDTGGLSSAATYLHRSQPAISRRIALLETELGMPLFDRMPGGVLLNEAGQALVPYARQALAAMKDCEEAVREFQTGMAGPLSLAVVGTLAGANLTPVLERFSSTHPGVDLRLRTATSAEVSNLVRGGEATIGLRYHTDNAPDLQSTALYAEPLHIICSPKHPHAGSRVRSLRKLASERWLTFPNAWKTPETTADNLHAQFLVLGITDIDWMAVDSLTAQKRLVEAGYGLAVLPNSAIREEIKAGTLSRIQVTGLQLANPVCLLTRKGGYLSPIASDFIKLLHDSED